MQFAASVSDLLPLADAGGQLDVALYIGVVGTALFLLLSPGVHAGAPWLGEGGAARLSPLAVGVLLAFLVALGLRDKVPFLAARAEV